MKSRLAILAFCAGLLVSGTAQAGPIAQNVLRNLGWWYGPGYHAFNACPGYPKHCWAYCPTTFPAPVPWGVAMPQRGACCPAGGAAPAYYGYGDMGPAIFHYPATPYEMAPDGGVEMIHEPTPGTPLPETPAPSADAP